jgi:hypothetical protein
MSTPLETLTKLRKTYPTPMSNDQLGELLNATAWIHRAECYGVLRKPNGSNCKQPVTGTLISRDILMLAPDGRIFDCLIDAEGKAIPTWGEKSPLNPKLFVPPVDVTMPPPDPPDPPPSSTQPYPDEPTWWAAFEAEQEALYAQAGQTVNWSAFRWSSRTGYDIGAGMDKDQSKAKHLAELRHELGL